MRATLSPEHLRARLRRTSGATKRSSARTHVPGMIGVRVVGRPHEAVGADVVDDVRRGGLVGIAGDEALAAEVLASASCVSATPRAEIVS